LEALFLVGGRFASAVGARGRYHPSHVSRGTYRRAPRMIPSYQMNADTRALTSPARFRLPTRLPSTRPTPASRRLQTSRCRCARRPIPAPSRRSNHRVRLAVGALMDGARRSLQHHRPRNRPNALAAVSEHCPRRAHSGR
jgi:hypothetical protein